jgi:hypothetical protein
MPLESKHIIALLVLAVIAFIAIKYPQYNPLNMLNRHVNESNHEEAREKREGLDGSVYAYPNDGDFIDPDANSLPSDMDSNDSASYARASKNSAENGQYKKSNYVDGQRSGSSPSLDAFYEDNGSQYTGKNDGFAPMDANDQYATYVPGNTVKSANEENKFNPSSLLPKEKGGEWFDDPYESTSVKGSHLINIYRPIGVTTGQTTLKNPSHDIRGTIPNPKYPVSPWANSSYEPDTNLKTLC